MLEEKCCSKKHKDSKQENAWWFCGIERRQVYQKHRDGDKVGGNGSEGQVGTSSHGVLVNSLELF